MKIFFQQILFNPHIFYQTCYQVSTQKEISYCNDYISTKKILTHIHKTENA